MGLFLRKSCAGTDCFVNTRKENAVVACQSPLYSFRREAEQHVAPLTTTGPSGYRDGHSVLSGPSASAALEQPAQSPGISVECGFRRRQVRRRVLETGRAGHNWAPAAIESRPEDHNMFEWTGGHLLLVLPCIVNHSLACQTYQISLALSESQSFPVNSIASTEQDRRARWNARIRHRQSRLTSPAGH